MPVRSSSAVWNGNLAQGSGHMHLASGAYDGEYTFASRFENARGTNPEELIGAAHAGCFSMFLSSILSKDGFTVKRISTTARVHLGDGPKIDLIELETEGEVTGIDEQTFRKYAETAKQGCPVSQALAAVEMHLSAKLVK
jgi:lipoyl-dependent peroxiredoxin